MSELKVKKIELEKMSISIRIKDCIDNHDKYIAVMAALPDKELAKKLDLVHIQMELAIIENTNKKDTN